MSEWAIEGEFNNWIKRVAISSYDGKTKGGEYIIRIAPRPHYCDRGDWMFYVDSEGDSCLDFADGFPRYFFGTITQAQAQMDTWISRRKEIWKEP